MSVVARPPRGNEHLDRVIRKHGQPYPNSLWESHMPLIKDGLASQSVEIGRQVLYLSTLGIFTKLLHIDLSKVQVLGVTLEPASASLIPGFIGIALVYAWLAFVAARLEAAVDQQISPESKEVQLALMQKQHRGVVWVIFGTLPITLIVYSSPYVVGAFAIFFLRSDFLAVFDAIWHAV